MTPTTPEQAREIAMHLFFPNGDNGYALKSLADQVEALTKERDALAAEVVRLDAGWHDANGDTLDKALELDKIKAAAKLALEVCLDMRRYGDQRGVAMAIGAEAALRQAGVQ